MDSAHQAALEMSITSLVNHKRTHADISDEELAGWVLATCLMFGTQVSTAYKIAGLFVEGIRENPRRLALAKQEGGKG